jgi:hypothetical protein
MKLNSVVLPYLLLVTFYSGELHNFDFKKVHIINESPYYGVAVPLMHPYDTKKFALTDFVRSAVQLRDTCKKHIWPWVFFNRFYSYKERPGSHRLSKVKYFQDIKGMDIYNKTGALTDFYQIWRNALKLSLALDSPGIVVDPEEYNNHDLARLSYLAEQVGKSEDEVKQRLKAIGAELVDIADETCPRAILWFLYTGIATPVRTQKIFPIREFSPISYIVLGMLERAKAKGSKIKIVSGGEDSLGYCHISYDDLQKTVIDRNKAFKSALDSYPRLYLGGTIAPWNEVKVREGYWGRNKCGNSMLKNMDDFQPLITYLLKSYDYIWIYAASGLNYDPYDAKIYPVFNKVIHQALVGAVR